MDRVGSPEVLTADGKRFVNGWKDAQTALASAKQRVSSEESRLSNAESALIKWLCPEDVKVGEKLAVWHLDSLIQVEVTGLTPTRGKLSVRARGDSLGR